MPKLTAYPNASRGTRRTLTFLQRKVSTLRAKGPRLQRSLGTAISKRKRRDFETIQGICATESSYLIALPSIGSYSYSSYVYHFIGGSKPL